MTKQEDYRQLLSDYIKKQMIMLGPNLVLSRAKKLDGLKVADDGSVTAISGNPGEILARVRSDFEELSGHIAHHTLQRLLAEYPALKNQLGKVQKETDE